MGYSFSKLNNYQNLNEKIEADKKYYEGIIKKIETHNNTLLNDIENQKKEHKNAIKILNKDIRREFTETIDVLKMERENANSKTIESLQRISELEDALKEHKNSIYSLEDVVKEC